MTLSIFVDLRIKSILQISWTFSLECMMQKCCKTRLFEIILTHHSLTSQKRLKIQSCSSFQFWCSALLCHFVGWNRILKRMQFLCILSIFAYYHAPSSLPKLYYTTDTGFSFLSSVNSQLPLKRHKKIQVGEKRSSEHFM